MMSNCTLIDTAFILNSRIYYKCLCFIAKSNNSCIGASQPATISTNADSSPGVLTTAPRMWWCSLGPCFSALGARLNNKNNPTILLTRQQRGGNLSAQEDAKNLFVPLKTAHSSKKN